MTKALLKTAIIYDFDGTLARGNIQEHSFIPKTGMTREEFWDEVNQRTRSADADEILVYMHLMLERARRKGIDVTADNLREHGRQAELFDGLADRSWFDRLNDHATECELELEHYIISSGIHEMIRACLIYDAFTHVFASKFLYVGSKAVAPGVAINYTTKTQYLFRIDKGIRNTWNSTRWWCRSRIHYRCNNFWNSRNSNSLYSNCCRSSTNYRRSGFILLLF